MNARASADEPCWLVPALQSGKFMIPSLSDVSMAPAEEAIKADLCLEHYKITTKIAATRPVRKK